MPSMPDSLVLCGGAGLRLRSIIQNNPKGMADVAGRPFLELLLRQLHRYGLERAILAVGYQANVIQSHFGDRAFGLSLTYSVELDPLGTGGALRNAADLVKSESVLVMNGDSYTDADLSQFVQSFHEARADASLVVVPADARGDCGSVSIDSSGRLASFDEKRGPGYAPYVNAGIYMVSKKLLYGIPAMGSISLEKELFPRWLQQGKNIGTFVCHGECIDIGTPERYAVAQTMLANAEAVDLGNERETQQ